jgi:hypothetical protein
MALLNLVLTKPLSYNNFNVTPARVLIDLLTQNGLTDYIGDSLTYADSVLTTNGILYTYNFQLTNKTTISDAINKLSKCACADIFLDTQNKIQMLVWDKSQTAFTPVVTFKKSYLASPLIIDDTIRDIINNYKIKVGAVEISDETATNKGSASRKQNGDLSLEYLDFSVTQQISTDSQQTAIWLGESYISRWGQPMVYIDAEIDNTNFSGFLQLGMFVAFDSSVDYENLVGMVFQIINLVENNDRYWGITLRKVS